jgi:peptidoglycan/LPS O-acetylase OafA/YrhL
MKSIVIPVAWSIAVIAAVIAGFSPNPYLEHVRNIPPPHPYPTATVLWVVLLMTIQAGALIAILRPGSYQRSWGRALVALVVSLGFLVVAAIASMHTPPPFAVYQIWALALAVVMLLLLLWSSINAIRTRASA